MWVGHNAVNRIFGSSFDPYSSAHQNHPSIPGGQSESIFKTCDMGVSGDFCFVHTNTTKMAAIITETVK